MSFELYEQQPLGRSLVTINFSFIFAIVSMDVTIALRYSNTSYFIN